MDLAELAQILHVYMSMFPLTEAPATAEAAFYNQGDSTAPGNAFSYLPQPAQC